MAAASHQVKGTDGIFRTVRSEMDIDGCGFKRFMTKQGFYGHKINPIFIEVCSKSMPEM